jgi:C_GCAxxG_C_C family probable redox protein
MSTKVHNAVSLFEQGFNCSQAILATYGEEFGLNHEAALKVASGFGGGMGRSALTCGAVTGAFMVLGLKYGPGDVKDKRAKEHTYELVREFVVKFKSRNGSIFCSKLLGCDISTPAGAEIARQKGLFDSVCPKMVQEAAEILEEMMCQ